MNYLKIALLALLIPSTALPMQWLKSNWKKATAGAIVAGGTLAYLMYKDLTLNNRLGTYEEVALRKQQNINVSSPITQDQVPQEPFNRDHHEQNIVPNASINQNINLLQSQLPQLPQLRLVPSAIVEDDWVDLANSAITLLKLPIELAGKIEAGFNKIATTTPMNPYNAFTQITLGTSYMRSIMEGKLDQIPTATQEEYLRSLVALNWFFYSFALENGQGFDEGTFVIEDKDFKIYNFIMNYIKKFNPTITGTIQDPLAFYSKNPFAYSRDASHFVDRKKLYRPYGIDMRFGPNGREESMLPANKKHMLCGKIDEAKQLLYIKPENHGLYLYDGLPGHVHEYVMAQVRKSPRIKGVLAWFGWNIGSDDAAENRKERIPVEFLQALDALLKNDSELSKDEKDQLSVAAKKQGLQTLTSEQVRKSAELKKLAEEYAKQYTNLEMRHGREIIIKADDIIKRLYSS